MKLDAKFNQHPGAGPRWAGPGQSLLHRLRLQTLITLRWIAVAG